jgi:hypothetical protein
MSGEQKKTHFNLMGLGRGYFVLQMSEGKSFTVWHYSRSDKKECLAGTLLELKILGMLSNIPA